MQEYFQRENLYPLFKPIFISEELTEFYKIRKHYMIFTEAGKPIYTRWGNEQVLSTFLSTLSAVIPKISSYFWSTEDPDSVEKSKKLYNANDVRSIRSGKFITSILRKGALFYVCLCSEMRSPNPKTEDSIFTREYFLEEKDFLN